MSRTFKDVSHRRRDPKYIPENVHSDHFQVWHTTAFKGELFRYNRCFVIPRAGALPKRKRNEHVVKDWHKQYRRSRACRLYANKPNRRAWSVWERTGGTDRAWEDIPRKYDPHGHAF